MIKQILLGMLLATLTALSGCFLLGDGQEAIGTMNIGFLKFMIFYLPLALILFVTVKLIRDKKSADTGHKILMLVVIPNVMMMPLILVWVGFGNAIQKVLVGN